MEADPMIIVLVLIVCLCMSGLIGICASAICCKSNRTRNKRRDSSTGTNSNTVVEPLVLDSCYRSPGCVGKDFEANALDRRENRFRLEETAA